ncbi:helix-hairpin-helix domain-containing protein [Haloactinospora alba]|nr:helix-hairpin-helix domain-containing protein [Haloactinospora alba]
MSELPLSTEGSTVPSSPSPEEGGSAPPAQQLRQVLASMGAPETLAEPVTEALGPQAAALLTEDPWQLLTLGSVTVEQADYCAHRLLGPSPSPDDPRRLRAIVRCALSRAAREGHTVLEEHHLSTTVRDLGGASPRQALEEALQQQDVVPIEVVEDTDEEGEEEPPDPTRYYALADLGQAEQELGTGVARLAYTSEPIMDSATAAETAAATAERFGMELAGETTAAVVTAALRGVCVLAHGAGASRGVSHALACCADVAAESGTGIAVAAPTAQSAQALNAQLDSEGVSGVRAVPLPQLLECSSPGVFERGPEHPLEAGLVVVTSAMALDTRHAAALVRACGDGTHLVLLADPDQAPSAGPGQVVRDLLASGTVASATVPSDPAPDPITAMAELVAAGEWGEVPAPHREVAVVPASSGEEAAHRVLQLLTDSIPRALGIPAEETQIVTATRGGEAGADALNAACKSRFNPGAGRVDGLDSGDRVRFTTDGPGHAAGDVGYVRALDDDGATVDLANGTVATGVDRGKLRLGWAVTVAAAHGGHWPAAIAVFDPRASGSRPQVYTAATRALRHLSVVHASGPELTRAVRDNVTLSRHTCLMWILRGA